ncbi:MAG: DNA primase [Chlamydiae bacterium]|nr:DNA primase [Chlamydiota bacterium]
MLYTKESLQTLRERVDLVELLSSHVELKRSGGAYKGLCPFHEEKTPSFGTQRGDSHYHCFGCGAHGDAIEFLMSYLNLRFTEAVEMLAEKFHVSLETMEGPEEKGTSKALLKKPLSLASAFYHDYLLYSEEGRGALEYLFKRGLTIDFLSRFEIGYAPNRGNPFFQAMRKEKFSDKILEEVGLLREGSRLFFRERITFPIRDHAGQVIGFSARKIKEETFGGKYINTPETPLFKKSRTLFGLNYSRRRIAKEKRALIVEGQIDCLRLIEAGLNLTVASLGTAFGESHVELLTQLGVQEVYLLFDGDTAGKKALSTTGDLFQRVGVEAKAVPFPEGSDPDTYLAERGTESLLTLLEKAPSYLEFQVAYLGQQHDPTTPAGKAELIRSVKRQIEGWDDPVMVYESLRKVAKLLQVPEQTVLGTSGYAPSLYIKKRGALENDELDPNQILELDLLRWLYILGEERPDFFQAVEKYLTEEHFWTPTCRTLFRNLLKVKKRDLLALAHDLEDPTFLDKVMEKRVNLDRGEKLFIETLQKILDRQWLQTREKIKIEIHSGNYGDDAVLDLVKEFDALKGKRITAAL